MTEPSMEPHLHLAGSTGNYAAPALEVESASDLRRQLAKAIEIRRDAAERARIAVDIADRAEATKNEASQTVERLKQALDGERCVAIQKYAQAFSATAADSEALSLALARLSALHQSTCELATEAATAKGEAAKASAAVMAIIDDITFDERHQLRAIAIAAVELHWRTMDRLIALVLIDEKRPDPQLRPFQDELLKRVDRRRSAIAADPNMVEQHAWNSHLAGLYAEQERAWYDYSRRLAHDPAATFDTGEATQ